MVGMACAKPADPGAPTDPQMIGRLQADLLITAMACDLTRVGTVQWENSVGGMRFTWLGGCRVLERVRARRDRLMIERPTVGVADAPRLLWQAVRWRTER